MEQNTGISSSLREIRLKTFVSKWQLIIAAEKSPEELTAAIQALLEQNEDYKKLKTVPGFSLEYTVTPEKKLLSTSVIDLNQIDAKSLEEISYFKDAGLNDLKNMKADALVKALKLHGMKEEGQ